MGELAAWLANQLPHAPDAASEVRREIWDAGRRSISNVALRTASPGLTLVELLLVLTLLVLISGLAMPSINGAFARARVNHAGDQVRTAWARTRLASLETGQTHTWRCQWGTSQFENRMVVFPLVDDAEASRARSDARPDADSEASSVTEIHDALAAANRLTAGIVFSSGQWEGTAVRADDDIGQWSAPIYFYPDGTTSDATVLIQGIADERLRVTLRGATGVSRTGSPRPSDG